MNQLNLAHQVPNHKGIQGQFKWTLCNEKELSIIIVVLFSYHHIQTETNNTVLVS